MKNIMKKLGSLLLATSMVVTAMTTGNAFYVKAATVPSEANLLNTYGNIFENVGTALVASEALDSRILDIAASEYNSVTIGNEMKPDYILGWSARTVTVEEAKARGYIIPDSYKEATVPLLDYSTVDKCMAAIYRKGLRMRGHTLVWHSQTPDWFFRQGYAKSNSYVDKETMYAREEFYIRNYVGHVCESPYGEKLYAWDVVNEYFHANSNPSGWQKIYGENLGATPEFVKRAFEYTYDTLKLYNQEDKVSLFYNDYNTYMEVRDVIALVKYINSDRKICSGVGMQAHLDTNFPTTSGFKSALQSFCNEGFEVQITELDVTCTDLDTQAKYYYELMKGIMDVKAKGGNITALIWWGLTDDTSWRSSQRPLMYSTYGVKKKAYDSVLQAYFDAGYKLNEKPINPITPGDPIIPSTPVDPSKVNTANTMQCENMELNGEYASAIDSPFDGVALYANSDRASYYQKFGAATHDFTLRGCSNNSNTATVDLYIGGEKKGTFKFTSSTPQNVTLSNITHITGDVEIELQCANDDNTWDAYIDVLSISAAGSATEPVDPEPVDPTPVDPTPVDPTPVDPTPVDPEPVDPTPVDPTPVDPIPVDPTPVNPETGLKVDYTINNWGSGYQVLFKISNTGAVVNTWTLKVKKSDVTISSSWNVNIKESGEYYIITPVEWNSAIYGGGTVEFGVQGSTHIGTSVECSIE